VSPILLINPGTEINASLVREVDPLNRTELAELVRLGFRLRVDDCVRGDVVEYTTFAQFEQLREMFESSIPDLELPVVCGVDAGGFGRYVHASSDHRLPKRILALVTGYRSGVVRVPITIAEFDVAIALLTPARAATIYEHPNLEAWLAIRENIGAASDVAINVQFGE
jgi:hypothetical protein